jgi:hypothetical protein
MKNAKRAKRRVFWMLILVGVALPFGGCGPGTVYVGVAAPGPWVGYPGRGYPGYGYPGYGRPWYSPDQEVPEVIQTPVEIGPPEAPPLFPWEDR